MTTPRDPSYDRLDQRVTAIEASIDKIGVAITSLGEKFDTRFRPQWILIVAALGLVVTILGLVLAGWKAPIDSTIVRQEYDLRQLQDRVVPRVEMENHWSATMREADEMRRRLDRLEDRAFSPLP
ncbi:hypothetical protein ASD04_07040 [Devosia sp. Root436]|uniref:hypothetical protein n=1 Tax=Devosia sp. Root436 TaxID=1736537 RepID=UPI0006FA80D6|nr:hypothetical protein [Devosia sp. Root436]KQX40378.1 hypothetical protein ASD04_07040 [Devosia sp. Root436]